MGTPAPKVPRKRVPGVWMLVPALGVALIFGSPALRDFNNKWESGGRRVLTVFPDKLAGGLPTVCDGLTRHVTRTPIIVGERWTEEKCEREERAAWIKVQTALVKCFKVAPPQSVFDMASSHAWNNGVPNTCGSVAMQTWNAGRFEDGCRRLARSVSGKPVWSSTCKVVAGRKVCTYVPGLQNRRQDEDSVCRQLGTYNPGEAVWQ